jgi:uncharacterized membrane protein YgdD (TMEM256/DUF423 family)
MSGMAWFRIGAISAALAVGAGAFGAHGLKGRLTETGYSDVFETAVRYHMYHALAMLALGLLSAHAGRTTTSSSLAGWSFLAGTILFSGSLYALSLSGVRWLGAITPLGGVGFLIGWAALVIASLPVKVPALAAATWDS